MSNTEYLTSLRETHTASGTDKETIQVGDVHIAIVHDDAPGNKWRLGIVKELQREQDGYQPTFKPLMVLLADQ